MGLLSRGGDVKFSGHGLFAYLAAIVCSASCGRNVGGLVVDRWLPLAEGAWSLEPGTDDSSWCKEIVLAEEMYISAIRPITSPGTHHVTLNLASTDEDGGCTVGRFGPETIYAASAETGEVRMPPGVAMRLREGQALHLNLHLYNATSQRLDGVSGIEVVRANSEAVKDEAGFVLAGPDSIILPPRQRTTITQTCRFTSAQTAVVLIPLMHQLGVQFKTTVTRGEESTILYDGPFQFEDQGQLSIGMLALSSGDSITIECTYENPKYIFVTKGHDGGEICYSALLRYPSDAPIDCAPPDMLQGR
ncbi:MAG TPA: hypothetical protein VK540_09640 [Polyangiaceae bacterium]|nr:hypothetical protein [Polyangiaceae bacterium]